VRAFFHHSLTLDLSVFSQLITEKLVSHKTLNASLQSSDNIVMNIFVQVFEMFAVLEVSVVSDHKFIFYRRFYSLVSPYSFVTSICPQNIGLSTFLKITGR